MSASTAGPQAKDVRDAIVFPPLILREERDLSAKFGPAYAGYCQRVRRWV